jgi:hypothetical protein
MSISVRGSSLKNVPKNRFKKNLFKKGEIIKVLETMYKVMKNDENMF